MRTHSDEIDLKAELRALRPEPRPEFGAGLDRRAAEGFARRGADRAGRLRARLRSLPVRRVAIPAGALALVALVAATAVIAIESGEEPPPGGGGSLLSLDSEAGARPEQGAPLSAQSERATPGRASSAGSTTAEAAVGVGTGNRRVEHDAELVLRTAPEQVGDDARRVFAVVGDSGGIVLNSSIRDRGPDAGARFLLLIPAGRLGRTLADLSEIGEVASRRESTRDITAPTVSVAAALADSTARIDGLLAQLAGTESDEERVAVEAELRRERRQAAILRSQLDRLRKHARYARVTVGIESGGEADRGAALWGVDDALDDAGRLLTIAAGVALIALAILAPLAALALLTWLASRAWVGRRRRRALI